MRHGERLLCGAVLLLLFAGTALAYHFFGGGRLGVVSSAGSYRWEPGDFPLRFRILENDHLPPVAGLSAVMWRELIERAFVHWTAIPTARITIVVEEETVAAERSLAAPYRTPFEHLEDDAEAGDYTAFPMGFALDSRLSDAGEVLVQSLSLAHFGPLHLLAESPGCNSVEVLCEDGDCDVQ